MSECAICLEKNETDNFTFFRCGHKTCTYCFKEIVSNK